MDKPQMDPNIAPPGEENAHGMRTGKPSLLITALLAILVYAGLGMFALGIVTGREKQISQTAAISAITTPASTLAFDQDKFRLLRLGGVSSNRYQDLVAQLDSIGFRIATYDEFMTWNEWITSQKGVDLYPDVTTLVPWGENSAFGLVYSRGYEREPYLEIIDPPGSGLLLIVRKLASAPQTKVVQAEPKSAEQKSNWPIFKTITIGNYGSVDDLRKVLTSSGCQISSWVDYLLSSPPFELSGEVVTIDLVRLTVAELGFPAGATYAQICARAKELGLELCPAEVGPQLRLAYNTQPQNEWLIVAMAPIIASGGSPNVFRLGRSAGGPWLYARWANPTHEWDPGDEFVFRLRK